MADNPPAPENPEVAHEQGDVIRPPAVEGAEGARWEGVAALARPRGGGAARCQLGSRREGGATMRHLATVVALLLAAGTGRAGPADSSRALPPELRDVKF